MIRMMCEVRLIHSVLTDALHDKVGVIVQIENIIQSCLHWYGYVMHGDINSQICEVMKLQTTGKRKKGSIKKIVQRKHKEGSEMIWLENRA